MEEPKWEVCNQLHVILVMRHHLIDYQVSFLQLKMYNPIIRYTPSSDKLLMIEVLRLLLRLRMGEKGIDIRGTERLCSFLDLGK